jgi:hypothetical protein
MKKLAVTMLILLICLNTALALKSPPLTFKTRMPDKVDANSFMDIAIKVERKHPVSIVGKFTIESDGELLGQKQVTIINDVQIVEIRSRTPLEHGIKLIEVSYIEDGEKLSSRGFNVDVKNADISIYAPEEVNLNDVLQTSISLKAGMTQTSRCNLRMNIDDIDVVKKSVSFDLKEGYNTETASVSTGGLAQGKYFLYVDCYLEKGKVSDFVEVDVIEKSGKKERNIGALILGILIAIILFGTIGFIVYYYIKEV